MIDERAHRLLCHPGGGGEVGEPAAAGLDPAQHLAVRGPDVGESCAGQTLVTSDILALSVLAIEHRRFLAQAPVPSGR